MRNFFYGISVFLFLCLLSLGYYDSYQKTAGRKSGNTEAGLSAEKLPLEEAVSAGEEQGSYGSFYLRDREGKVVVYGRDRTTVYEPTSIPLSSLPEDMQEKIRSGMYLKTQEELYSFLENYSS